MEDFQFEAGKAEVAGAPENFDKEAAADALSAIAGQYTHAEFADVIGAGLDPGKDVAPTDDPACVDGDKMDSVVLDIGSNGSLDVFKRRGLEQSDVDLFARDGVEGVPKPGNVLSGDGSDNRGHRPSFARRARRFRTLTMPVAGRRRHVGVFGGLRSGGEGGTNSAFPTLTIGSADIEKQD